MPDIRHKNYKRNLINIIETFKKLLEYYGPRALSKIRLLVFDNMTKTNINIFDSFKNSYETGIKAISAYDIHKKCGLSDTTFKISPKKSISKVKSKSPTARSQSSKVKSKSPTARSQSSKVKSKSPISSRARSRSPTSSSTMFNKRSKSPISDNMTLSPRKELDSSAKSSLRRSERIKNRGRLNYKE